MTDQDQQEQQKPSQEELERLFREGKLSRPLTPQEEQERMQQEMKALQSETAFQWEVISAIESLGEKLYRGAIPLIEQRLHDKDPVIRAAALKSLTCSFGLEEHWETAKHFLLEDPDEQCRVAGAESLSYLKQDSGDLRTLALLASVVCDKDAPKALRQMTCAALLAVRHYDGREWYTILNESYDLDGKADWELVKKYIS